MAVHHDHRFFLGHCLGNGQARKERGQNKQGFKIRFHRPPPRALEYHDEAWLPSEDLFWAPSIVKIFDIKVARNARTQRQEPLAAFKSK
jgi:hypothetical protein